MLQDLKRRYPTKPIILGEIGAEESGDKAEWIRDAYTNMLSDPQVVAAVWFNMKKEADWRISSSQGAANAYRQMMTLSAVKDRYDDSVLRGVMVASR